MSTHGGTISRIILVEDRSEDASLFKIITRELAPHIDLVILESGQDCLAYLSDIKNTANSKTVIFLDIKLPGENGIEILQELKTRPTLRAIPVIIFTSSAAPQDYSQAYNSFANAYLQKPIEVVEFRKVLKKAIDFWFSAVTVPVSES